MTPADLFVNISFVRARQQRLDRERKNDTERYRSGHNEAVLKTVCPNGHMGSNPILSAKDTSLCCINHIYHIGRYLFGEIPKRPKGLPWKGSRSGEPARGFKSLFLRSKRWNEPTWSTKWFVSFFCPKKTLYRLLCKQLLKTFLKKYKKAVDKSEMLW